MPPPVRPGFSRPGDIEAGFAALFKAEPQAKVDVVVEAVRFPAADLAIEEGVLRQTRHAKDLPTSTVSNNLFQLAVNKDGVLRGNYYEALTETTKPVYGATVQATQKAAWTVGKKADRVFEAGAYNLTQTEAPCLLHLGTEKTEQLLLVRRDAPADGK